MKTWLIGFVLGGRLLLAGDIAPTQPPPVQKTVQPSGVDATRVQAIANEQETLRAKFAALQQELETIRLRTCMTNNLNMQSCGSLLADGKVTVVEAEAKK